MNSSSFLKILNWQVRVGRLFGIPIFLHISILFFLWPVLSGDGLGFGLSVEYAVLIVLSILIHELGHALSAKHFRLRDLSITLHGFGGFAMSTGSRSPRQDLIVTLAGPAATFGVGIVCLGISQLAPAQTAANEDLWMQFWIIKSLGHINILLGFFNLIPLLPWDGGHALRAILSFKISYFKASRAAAHFGMIIAPPLIIYAFATKANFFFLFGGVGLITCYTELRNTGGFKFGEFFADRRARKEEEAAIKRSRARHQEFLGEVSARQRERDEKERLRKLLGED